jgi:hypothetical protein
MAEALQSKPGSRQWFGGIIQSALMATPGLELVRDLKGVRTEVKPPIQTGPPIDFEPITEAPAAPPVQTVNPADVAAANRAASNAAAQQVDQAIPAEAAPSVAADEAAAKVMPETQTAPSDAGAAFQIPTNQIATRPDLMQFKAMTNETTGTNTADQITTPYDPIKAGNLLLWEPTNPQDYGLTDEEKYIVANGHHRNEAATNQGVETQNAQILRESAGYSPRDARVVAAEANIADGKGTVYDAANYIRGQAETEGPDAALDRARQIGARSQKAASIAINSGPDLYSSFVNERITPEAAASIADIAPGNDGLQRLGIQRAIKGDQPQEIYNFLQATQAQLGDAAPKASQVDLFASDDGAIKAAEEAAKRAGAIQREIGDQINAVAGAAKRPEKAAALGVNVSDPASVNAKLADLRTLRERARSWALDPQIRDLAMRGEMDAPEAVKALSPVAAGLRPVGETTATETSRSDVATATPFELAAPETAAEMEARKAAEAEQNATLQDVAEKQAQVKYGWQQPNTGTAGDLGQMALPGEQPSDLFGFGPGAAASGEIEMRTGSQLRQLGDTVSAALKESPSAPAVQRVEKAITASKKSPNAGIDMDGPKAAWMALRDWYRNPVSAPLRDVIKGRQRSESFMDALKDWQGADQRTSFEVRRWIQDSRKQIPDRLVRQAITRYIQAVGDVAKLRAQAEASKDTVRPQYELATSLGDTEKTIGANVRQYFDGMLNDGINADLMEQGIDNYITQMWQRPNKFTQELQADLQSGKLQKDFKYARRRVFDSFFEGEQAGYEPLTTDFTELVAAYDLAFRKSLSARAFIKSLREAVAADGEPIVRFSGMTQKVPRGEVPAEAYLIRSRALPDKAIAADGRRYIPIDHPALRGWKFVVQAKAELPSYYQADMLVHPDHYEHLANVLGNSWFRQKPVFAQLLKAGAIAKQTRLSLSAFHLDQEGLHGLFHRVNPANLEQINFDDPKQWALVRGGLQVADYSAMEMFSEGLRGGGLVAKVPVLGELQNRFNEFLFKDYIPRLKMTMALHAFDRNAARYPDLAPDIIAEKTAQQANAAFGELNYKLMGRSPTVQDFMRLSLLAPDFLEARARFVGQALKPYGGEQRAALMLGAATLYVTARVLNQWLDNDPHWDWKHAFSVIYNGREYRLRTVMGDFANLVTDPQRFFYNRFSPWLKTGATWMTGRDYRGIKLNNWEKVKDTLSWFVPIPLGSGNEATNPQQYVEQTPQRLLSSAGVENKPTDSAISVAYKSALDFKKSLTDPKIQAEVQRANQETYAMPDYARLDRALMDNDKERAVQEIVALMRDKGKTPADLLKRFSNLPDQPFTGSQMLDYRWQRAMPAEGRVQYRSARNQQINMARTFSQLLPIATRLYRVPQVPQQSGQLVPR